MKRISINKYLLLMIALFVAGIILDNVSTWMFMNDPDFGVERESNKKLVAWLEGKEPTLPNLFRAEYELQGYSYMRGIPGFAFYIFWVLLPLYRFFDRNKIKSVLKVGILSFAVILGIIGLTRLSYGFTNLLLTTSLGNVLIFAGVVLILLVVINEIYLIFKGENLIKFN